MSSNVYGAWWAHLGHVEVALEGEGCVHVAVDLFELSLDGACAEGALNLLIVQEIVA